MSKIKCEENMEKMPVNNINNTIKVYIFIQVEYRVYTRQNAHSRNFGTGKVWQKSHL